jgi:hypothetical protein
MRSVLDVVGQKQRGDGVDPVLAFRDLRASRRRWPATLTTQPVTEVVYEGSLPLRACAFWRDAVTGHWHPGPGEVKATCSEESRW